MTLESARAQRHRRIAEKQRLEEKRLRYIDLLAGRDEAERARLSTMTVGQIICEMHRLPPTLPDVPPKCGQPTDWPGVPCGLFGGHPGGHYPSDTSVTGDVT